MASISPPQRRCDSESLHEIVTSIETAGFTLEEVWGGWDGSTLTPRSFEMIVLAQRE